MGTEYLPRYFWKIKMVIKFVVVMQTSISDLQQDATILRNQKFIKQNELL
jgi:hypothetical protein